MGEVSRQHSRGRDTPASAGMKASTRAVIRATRSGPPTVGEVAGSLALGVGRRSDLRGEDPAGPRAGATRPTGGVGATAPALPRRMRRAGSAMLYSTTQARHRPRRRALASTRIRAIPPAGLTRLRASSSPRRAKVRSSWWARRIRPASPTGLGGRSDSGSRTGPGTRRCDGMGDPSGTSGRCIGTGGSTTAVPGREGPRPRRSVPGPGGPGRVPSADVALVGGRGLHRLPFPPGRPGAPSSVTDLRIRSHVTRAGGSGGSSPRSCPGGRRRARSRYR
jgi:hypothetical protein